MTIAENNKRIAKNTLLLYTRMLLTMAVSLFTVRIILNTLGTVDYGLYNVVGGIVTMFSFFSGTMASAAQRFFAYELGKQNYDQLKKTFSMTMSIYIIIGCLILVLAETIGLWFLNNKMTIPVDRLNAAHWVYQFSILAFMMTMFTIPYNAIIIAHENMKVYAWVSIVEVTLKLIIVYILILFDNDKLKLYSILMFSVTTIVTFIYRTYCKKKYVECQYVITWDDQLFRSILSFSGWNLFGSMATIFQNQGINILLNVFFNPVINAARGIAFQINTAVNQFVINFSTAVNPQITKYYAIDEKENMFDLVIKSSKLAFYLMCILTMPLLLDTKFVLTLWLKDIPNYSIIFTKLVIISTLIDSLSGPLVTSALATGKIKIYQIVVGGVRLLNLPVSYIFLKQGFPPDVTMKIAIVVSVVNLFIRLVMLNRMIDFPISKYINQVLYRIILTVIIAYVLPIFMAQYTWSSPMLRFFILCAIGLFSSVTSIYIFGLTKNDKAYLRRIIKVRRLLKPPY